MTCRVAIVLGGAECWQRDLDVAHRLLSGRQIEYYVVNDQIVSFPGDIVACTLHPEKLDDWLDRRSAAKLSAPRECWTRNELKEWGGTSGLFAFQVARKHEHRRIIFCGVPMDDSRNAFHKHIGGIAIYSRHSRIWSRHRLHEIKPFARSVSGWTAELLGQPDHDWLTSGGS